MTIRKIAGYVIIGTVTLFLLTVASLPVYESHGLAGVLAGWALVLIVGGALIGGIHLITPNDAD